jgi:AraC-like DNA-binding protein
MGAVRNETALSMRGVERKRWRGGKRIAATLPAEGVGFSRYLPVEPDALDWGLHVVDYGHTAVPPGADYPQGVHPEGYLFTWDKGRVLGEYQFVYVTRGAGAFESKSMRPSSVEGGNVIVLFPGEWHRYRPVRSVGWTETWIGFAGRHAEELMRRFFSPHNALLQVGHDEELLRLMRSLSEVTEAAPAGHQQILAARAVEVIARVRSLAMSYRASDRAAAERIQRARCRLLERAERPVNLRDLAGEVGMSYSRFRSAFKAQTGLSPRQYQLQIRVNKACSLLADTLLPVAEVAARTGFESVYYFSRLFRRKTGVSPRQFRRQKVPEAPARRPER